MSDPNETTADAMREAERRLNLLQEQTMTLLDALEGCVAEAALAAAQGEG